MTNRAATPQQLPQGNQPEISTRASQPFKPASFDAEKMSVKFTATTESPATVWDWERYDFVQEVLRADGCILPASGRVPVLDSHNRNRVSDVLGSAGDFVPALVDGMEALDCTVAFSGEPEGKSAAGKVREGHLTDVSVGYNVTESFWVPENEKQIIAGREYTGPVKVSTKWELRELSITPIGADRYAKARSGPAQPQPTIKSTEVSTMNKRLKEMLVKRGMDAGATDEAAWAFYRALSADDQGSLFYEARSAAPVNADAAREEGTRAERQRVADITEACSIGGLEARAVEFITGGQSIDQVRAVILAELKTKQQPLKPSLEVGADERDKLRAAATDGLVLRSGLAVEKPAAGSREIRGRSLVRLAEECLRMAGVNTRTLSDTEIAKRAFSHSNSDFSNLLANVAERVLLGAYAIAPTTWQMFCRTVDATNFKNMDRIKLSESPDLDLVGPGGEYTEATLSDDKETYALGKYGKIFSITWEAIINDDLGALTRIPQLFGNAAARKTNSLVYAILTGNGNMADGRPLFSESYHYNDAATGDHGAPTIALISKGRAAMRIQKDVSGKQILNIAPKYFIHPAAMETEVEVILRSAAYPDSNTNSGKANPFGPGAKNQLIPVCDGTIDGTTTKEWYLLADNNQIDTIEVAFLNGQNAPYLEEKDGFKVDGREYKVRHCVAAKAVDYRGMYRNDGE